MECRVGLRNMRRCKDPGQSGLFDHRQDKAARAAITPVIETLDEIGQTVDSMREQLGMAPATLSFHLAHLSRVGLIEGERESRFIHYSANYGTMDELIAFLTSNCCQGKVCLPKTASCDTTTKRRGKSREST